MSKRFVVIVLDGFGMHAMKDAIKTRKGDEKSSTLGSILKDYPSLKLPNLEKLGLMNAFGSESSNMKFSPYAKYGTSELLHHGADTFMGHQEIMGSYPKATIPQAFSENIDQVAKCLLDHHHKVEVKGDQLHYLLVDDYCTVSDNIDSDLGMAFNCIAPLDYMSMEQELEIGKLVRSVVTVNRVIVFGGTNNTIEDILNAEEVRENKYIGLLASKTKAYDSGYQCLHLGYGVNEKVQVPTILGNAGYPVTLLGKVADIVTNHKGKSISCVDTQKVLELTIQEINQMDCGFICTNVQQTDLAGHSQNSKWYKEVLEIADKQIGKIAGKLNEEDVLIIMADHGNDPGIGHNKHTRENVPLLIQHGKKTGVSIGLRKTLSDVGATVCDYFNVTLPQNGESFLQDIDFISG